MRLGSSLVALLFAVSSTALFAQEAVAIRCEGRWYEGDDPKALQDRTESRVYIIDDRRKAVGYWNPSSEMIVPICDRTWLTCEITFQPKEVVASGQLNRSGLVNRLEINRRVGSVYQIIVYEKRRSSYFGDCKKIEMPRARVEDNKF